MVVEAAVAIGAGVVAHSLALKAFGIDSVIELTSAIVLIWRLRVELKRGETCPDAIERSAARIGGLKKAVSKMSPRRGSIRVPGREPESSWAWAVTATE